ncbi:ATP-binding cassette domain-containing protein [Bacillus sp. DTU_2020_1000418_1_SI_GHA_SEK_038]|uniref:ATP-binding cassette domain-containing protein n=1 Tax=Bacillus sp. DTU_2020_1000418_1_SI_GHA_SEK_038 TaxID=3077585 RepID=UPI0028E80E03|nr:ATP-binding cassette domain-containing protein [Bacillus sp. DTU_2020_1000418_1_SI_GHA_SEK_038]WNS73665.1 ATP-binding cassette domain-containing protein [Bacillus sp. DTU_2020_1000418_1_SI_GHA_SEK_038]
MKDKEIRIQMKNIHKSFGPVKPLQGVDLSLYKGECLGLLGDNGAGKSTLMKILSGVIIPDQGTFYVNGQKVNIRNPRDAKDLQIETVYQDLALCDTLNVANNIFLGREPVKFAGRLIDKKKLHQRTREELDKLGINIASTKLAVQNMSGGQRQAVAIARAMIFQPNVLILDEPTSALGVKEVNMVLELINKVKKTGVSVILITHRLQDLFEVCDRLMVLHEGKCIDNRPIEEFTLESVIKSIMGNLGVASK